MKLKINSNILLMAFTCITMFAIIEIILRLFFPIYHAGHIGTYQYDEDLGYRVKDDVYEINITDYRQEMKTNKLGTVNYQQSFDGYDKLVFAIGDSYTQGTGGSMDTNYPYQLDLQLNILGEKYVKNYGIVNLGLAAYGLEQSIIALKRYQKKLGAPDYILFLGCSNDYNDDILFLQGYSHKHLVDGNPKWGKSLKILQFLTNDLEIGKRLKIALSQYRRSKLLVKEEKADSNENIEPENIASLQEEKLNRLYDIASNMGAKLIVSWTDPPTKNSSSYDWLKTWAEQKNVGFADWAPTVASVKNAIPELPISNDHSGEHYRAWVNTIIAGSFAENVKK